MSCKIFKTELFSNLRYSNYKTSEDYELLTRTFLRVKKYVSVDQSFCYYVQTVSSISRDPFNKVHLDVIKARETAIKTYQKQNDEYEKICYVIAFKLIIWCFVLYNNILDSNNSANLEYQKFLVEKVKQYKKLALKSCNTLSQKIVCNLQYNLFVLSPKLYFKLKRTANFIK